MKDIKDQSYEKERSLYALTDAHLSNCRFAGAEDGESPLKEGSHLLVESCYFDLRYPFWHDEDTTVTRCEFTDKSRAAFWYDHGLTIQDCLLHGIKALRESHDIVLSGSDVLSPEFLWKCSSIHIEKSHVVSEYPFFLDEEFVFEELTLEGKYSFQYTKNGTVKDSELHTKDAFWHSENVTVYDTLIDGEYLGWYSKNLRLVRCHIKGTQPLCYCQGLVLEDCTMENADFAFEYSEVNGNVLSDVASIKNPIAGHLVVNSLGNYIVEGSKYPNHATIEILKK